MSDVKLMIGDAVSRTLREPNEAEAHVLFEALTAYETRPDLDEVRRRVGGRLLGAVRALFEPETVVASPALRLVPVVSRE